MKYCKSEWDRAKKEREINPLVPEEINQEGKKKRKKVIGRRKPKEKRKI